MKWVSTKGKSLWIEAATGRMSTCQIGRAAIGGRIGCRGSHTATADKPAMSITGARRLSLLGPALHQDGFAPSGLDRSGYRFEPCRRERRPGAFVGRMGSAPIAGAPPSKRVRTCWLSSADP